MRTVNLHFADLVEWVPKEDITAYELAQATTVLIAMAHKAPHVASLVREMSPEAQRHFIISANPLNK